MTDIVNDFFRKHYPADWDTAWQMRSIGADSYGREYTGDREAHSRIFPEIVCADGFKMSVQGHYGAYSYRIYPYVPVDVVLRVIDAHGGLATI